MFNVGGGEILVILVVALVVLGPDKLPGAMRTIGQVMGEVRKLSNGFQSEVRNAMYTDDRPTIGPIVSGSGTSTPTSTTTSAPTTSPASGATDPAAASPSASAPTPDEGTAPTSSDPRPSE